MTRYKDADQTLKLSGSINYNRNNDKDKESEIKQKEISKFYDKFLNPDVSLCPNAKPRLFKRSGVNNVLASIGVGFPLIDSDTTTLSVKVGPSLSWIGGGDDCSNDEYCGNSYGGAATVDFGWKPTTWFRFGAVNQFSAAFASEVKPYNSFTATFKFIPSTQTNLFTSLKFQSIYQSMSSPTSNNTVSGQVGVDF